MNEIKYGVCVRISVCCVHEPYYYVHSPAAGEDTHTTAIDRCPVTTHNGANRHTQQNIKELTSSVPYAHVLREREIERDREKESGEGERERDRESLMYACMYLSV